MVQQRQQGILPLLRDPQRQQGMRREAAHAARLQELRLHLQCLREALVRRFVRHLRCRCLLAASQRQQSQRDLRLVCLTLSPTGPVMVQQRRHRMISSCHQEQAGTPLAGPAALVAGRDSLEEEMVMTPETAMMMVTVSVRMIRTTLPKKGTHLSTRWGLGCSETEGRPPWKSTVHVFIRASVLESGPLCGTTKSTGCR